MTARPNDAFDNARDAAIAKGLPAWRADQLGREAEKAASVDKMSELYAWQGGRTVEAIGKLSAKIVECDALIAERDALLARCEAAEAAKVAADLNAASIAGDLESARRGARVLSDAYDAHKADAERLAGFAEAVARSACLDQRLGDSCRCYSCEASRVLAFHYAALAAHRANRDETAEGGGK